MISSKFEITVIYKVFLKIQITTLIIIVINSLKISYKNIRSSFIMMRCMVYDTKESFIHKTCVFLINFCKLHSFYIEASKEEWVNSGNYWGAWVIAWSTIFALVVSGVKPLFLGDLHIILNHFWVKRI